MAKVKPGTIDTQEAGLISYSFLYHTLIGCDNFSVKRGCQNR